MYTKQAWNAGDVITEEKLNHMEDGISNAGGVLIVNQNYNELMGVTTLDKTYKEIHDAYNNGTIVMIRNVDSQYFVTELVEQAGHGFIVKTCKIGNDILISYSADLEDGYPELGTGSGGGGVM